jgi:hypothetical protein
LHSSTPNSTHTTPLIASTNLKCTHHYSSSPQHKTHSYSHNNPPPSSTCQTASQHMSCCPQSPVHKHHPSTAPQYPAHRITVPSATEVIPIPAKPIDTTALPKRRRTRRPAVLRPARPIRRLGADGARAAQQCQHQPFTSQANHTGSHPQREQNQKPKTHQYSPPLPQNPHSEQHSPTPPHRTPLPHLPSPDTTSSVTTTGATHTSYPSHRFRQSAFRNGLYSRSCAGVSPKRSGAGKESYDKEAAVRWLTWDKDSGLVTIIA